MCRLFLGTSFDIHNALEINRLLKLDKTDGFHSMTQSAENNPSTTSNTILGAISVSAIKAFDDNYIWHIQDTETNQHWVVDPGEATPVLETLKQNNVDALAGILVTHHHHDHIGGIEEILTQYPDTPVYGIQSDRVPQVTDSVSDCAVLELSPNLSLTVMLVPGHTRDHIAYFRNDDSNPCLFSGDTLFVAGCGRLFEGTAAQMLDSFKKLRSLPSQTVNFCAHEYTLSNLKFAQSVEPANEDLQTFKQLCDQLRTDQKPTVPTTIAQEQKINPFMRWDKQAVIDCAAQRANKTQLSDTEIFAEIRAWKDNF